jgi:alkyl sulfatase BDS1-like metallo-beta-lactamase superfamily hydrolase
VLSRLILHETALAEAVEQGLVSVEGDAARVAELFSLLDDVSPMFEIVEPKRES